MSHGKKGALDAKCSACNEINAVARKDVAPPPDRKIHGLSRHGDESIQREAAIGFRQRRWPFESMPAVEGVARGDVAKIIAHVRILRRRSASIEFEETGMNRRCIAAGVIFATATAALAHQGVQNPAVKARMDGMSAIAENLKTLGMMARGATAFDAETARAAAAAIAIHASAVPGLFEANETDPMSEAKPAIWTSFEDFSAKASELESIAVGLSTSITIQEDLGPAMGSLGASCKSCHSIYRE